MQTSATGPTRGFPVSSVIVFHHTSSPQCLEDCAYKDVSTVKLPTVIPDTYKDNTYFKCLRVLCRDTQKHQQQNPGHVCVPKTSAEPRALTRSKIPIPLISQSRNWMVRVSATINLPTTTWQQTELQAPLFQPEPQQPGSSKITLPKSEPRSQSTQPQRQQQAHDPMLGMDNPPRESKYYGKN